MAKKAKLVIELTEKNIDDIEIILSEIGRRIDEGFTSGIEYPVNWYLKKD